MKIQQTHTPITRQGIMWWTLMGRETVPPQGAAQRVDWSRSPGAYRWLGNCIGLCWGEPCLLYTMCTWGVKACYRRASGTDGVFSWDWHCERGRGCRKQLEDWYDTWSKIITQLQFKFQIAVLLLIQTSFTCAVFIFRCTNHTKILLSQW